MLIVQQVIGGKSIYSLTDQFGISKDTIRRWVLRYNQTGSVQRMKRDAVAYKVTDAHVKFATDFLKKYPTTFLRDLINIMKEKFDDFDITEQWLGKILRANNITRKKVRKYHSPYYRYGKAIDRSEMKSKFYDEIKKYPLDRIICLDETAVQLFMYRNYARCRIGERCAITTTSNTVFKSYTLLVAICAKRVVGWKLYEDKGTDENRLVNFIDEFITGKYKKHLVVMDNAPSHRKKGVREAVENGGNELLKSIPFFPRSNAVENFFSQLKHYMRDEKTKTFDELKQTIAEVIKTKIKRKSLENYFKFAYGEKPVEEPNKPNPRIHTPPKYKHH